MGDSAGAPYTPLKYSIFSIARNALSFHEHWPLAWRSPRPRQAYDAVIVGGGGHGLATATIKPVLDTVVTSGGVPQEAPRVGEKPIAQSDLRKTFAKARRELRKQLQARGGVNGEGMRNVLSLRPKKVAL
jgi:hypothetical protein